MKFTGIYLTEYYFYPFEHNNPHFTYTRGVQKVFIVEISVFKQNKKKEGTAPPKRV